MGAGTPGAVHRDRGVVSSLLAQTNYQYIRIVQDDVSDALTRFKSLQPGVGMCQSLSSMQGNLIYLRGNLPILYRGKDFAVPIVVWILREYPTKEPLLKIELAHYMVVPHDYIGVSANGEVTLAIFYDWNDGQKSVRRLLENLSITFSHNPPVFTLDTSSAFPAAPDSQISIPVQKLRRSLEILHGEEMSFYQSKQVIVQHLMDVFKNYPYMSPAEGAFELNNYYARMKLLNINGNITVGTGPTQYVPVQLWIPQFYPVECPYVYVVTSSPGLTMVPSDGVANDGRVELPYTQHWNEDKTLVGIIEVMCAVFSCHSPVHITSSTPDSQHVVTPATTTHEDAVLCKVCLDAPQDVVFFLCLHMVACHQCAEALANCPICRDPIVRRLRVFPA